MADNQYSEIPLQDDFQHHVPNVGLRQGIEHGCHLITYQVLRPIIHCPSQAYTLQLATRKFVGKTLEPCFRNPKPLLKDEHWHARLCQDLPDGPSRIYSQLRMLEKKLHRTKAPVLKSLPINYHLTFLWLEVPSQNLRKGRLTLTTWPQKPHPFSWAQTKIQSPKKPGISAAIPEPNVLRFKHSGNTEPTPMALAAAKGVPRRTLDHADRTGLQKDSPHCCLCLLEVRQQ